MTIDINKLGKVAVLMGGSSSEREVSLMSGTGVLAALREEGVNAYAFDPSVQFLFDLPKEKFDRAFIALHGRFGEDGTLQGVLETLGIPYTGSGVMASALAMDKWRTKLVWLATGIPTPRFEVVTEQSNWPALIERLKLPLVIKPAHEGSSIGVTIVRTPADLAYAYNLAAKLDPLVIAEEFIAGQELTAAVVGGVALPLVRIQAPEGNYDFKNKYYTDDTKYVCPADIRADVAQAIQADALKAFAVLGGDGWGRADVMLKPDGSYYFLEFNTSPGMTSHSLVPMAARAAGLSYGALCVQIVALASLKK